MYRTGTCATVMLLVGISACLAIPAASKSVKSPQERALELTATAVQDFEQGRYSDAESLLNQAVSASESTCEPHFWLGRLHAQHAGSDPAEKQEAVTEFRRAIEISPFGESGDLARSWLLRIGGRPKSVIFAVANDSGETENNNEQTKHVLSELAPAAQGEGYFIGQTPEDPVSFPQADSAKLLNLCTNTTGDLSVGWLVCVSVRHFKVEEANNGKSSGRGNATVWMYDPIAKKALPSMNIYGSSLLASLARDHNETFDEASEDGIADLGRQIWRKCRAIINQNPDPKVLDQTSLPTAIPGVYAVSSLPYGEAITLPVALLTPCGAPPGDNAQDARRVGTDIQNLILKSTKTAIISPGNTQNALTSSGFASDDLTPDALRTVGQRLGSNYAIIISLQRLEMKQRDFLLFKKIEARATLNVKIIELSKGTVVLEKTCDEKKGTSRLLSPETLDVAYSNRQVVLDKVEANVAAIVGSWFAALPK